MAWSSTWAPLARIRNRGLQVNWSFPSQSSCQLQVLKRDFQISCRWNCGAATRRCWWTTASTRWRAWSRTRSCPTATCTASTSCSSEGWDPFLAQFRGNNNSWICSWSNCTSTTATAATDRRWLSPTTSACCSTWTGRCKWAAPRPSCVSWPRSWTGSTCPPWKASWAVCATWRTTPTRTTWGSLLSPRTLFRTAATASPPRFSASTPTSWSPSSFAPPS